ncbi:MAG: 50S ribosomal protein L32 [Acidimicrobiales bacterium]|nr:50S ribosomal protein L32 [Acidimicrobiales bacterium]
MAVPKKKTSKAKGRSRRASAWPIGQSARSLCERCGSIKRPHRICSNCGWYGGRQVIDVD